MVRCGYAVAKSRGEIDAAIGHLREAEKLAEEVVSFVIIINGMENLPEIGYLHNCTLMVCFPTAAFLVHWVTSEPTLR
jgi:hypothetical protein